MMIARSALDVVDRLFDPHRSARRRTLSPAKGLREARTAALNPKGQSTTRCLRSSAVGFAPQPRGAAVARSPAARAPPARPEGAVSAPLCATRLPRSSHRATSCGQGGELNAYYSDRLADMATAPELNSDCSKHQGIHSGPV